MNNILLLNRAIKILDSCKDNNDSDSFFDSKKENESDYILLALNPVNIVNSFTKISHLLIHKLQKLTNYEHYLGIIEKGKQRVFDLSDVDNFNEIQKMLDGMAFISYIDMELKDVDMWLVTNELIRAYNIIKTELNKVTLDEFAKYIEEHNICKDSLSANEKSLLFQTLCCIFLFKFYNEELKRAFKLVNKIIVVEGTDKVGKTSFINKLEERFEGLTPCTKIFRYKYPKTKKFYNDKNTLTSNEMLEQQKLYAMEIYNDLDEVFNNQFNFLAFTIIDRWFLSNYFYSSMINVDDLDYKSYLSVLDMLNQDSDKKFIETGLSEYFDIINVICVHSSVVSLKYSRGSDNIENFYDEDAFLAINDLYHQTIQEEKGKCFFNSSNLHHINKLLHGTKVVVNYHKVLYDSNLLCDIINEKVDNFIKSFRDINNSKQYGGKKMIKKIKEIAKQIKDMFDSSFKPTLKE